MRNSFKRYSVINLRNGAKRNGWFRMDGDREDGREYIELGLIPFGRRRSARYLRGMTCQFDPRLLAFRSLLRDTFLFSLSFLLFYSLRLYLRENKKGEKEGEDLPINLPTYLPTYLPTGCYLVTRRGLRLYDSPAVDDVVAPGVGVISTREGTYPPITVTSFSPLLPTVSPFLFRSPSLPRFVARNISSPHPSLLPVEQQQPSREFPSRIVGMTRR